MKSVYNYWYVNSIIFNSIILQNNFNLGSYYRSGLCEKEIGEVVLNLIGTDFNRPFNIESNKLFHE